MRGMIRLELMQEVTLGVLEFMGVFGKVRRSVVDMGWVPGIDIDICHHAFETIITQVIKYAGYGLH